MSVINTNITSLIAQGNLGKSQSALQTAMERLSSGLRINSAKDDAAGQAIANRMTAQITGLQQAQRNANDGISIAQTAEGSLNQVNDNLQRIRELAVQAANDTNSDADLQSIQEEIDQRLGEINRISEETAFNGVDVLATDQGLKIQVGANDGQSISVNLKEITAETLGLQDFSVANNIVSKDLTEVTGNISEAVAATTVELSYDTGTASNLNLFVGDDGALYAGTSATANGAYAATYDADTGTVSYNTSTPIAAAVTAATAQDTFIDGDGNVVELTTADAATQTDSAAAATYTIYQNNTTGALYAHDGTDSWTMGAGGNSIDLATGVVTLGTADGTTVATGDGTAASSGNVLTVPGTAAVAADMTGVDANLEGTNTLMQHENGDYYIQNENAEGDVTYYSATVAADGVVTEGAEALVDPLKDLDAALSQVDTLRSELGAVQNRFQDAINNLNTNATNLSAARSRIEDADYAVEVANMTKAQILQQAGTSVLAQANQVPQNVLSLLG